MREYQKHRETGQLPAAAAFHPDQKRRARVEASSTNIPASREPRQAELFDSSKQNISLRIKNILDEGELHEISVVKEYLTTASDGKRYKTKHYRKVRDLFALSSDYRDREEESHHFFAEVQNKLLFAVAGRTAAEIVVDRAKPNAPNL